MSEAGRENPKEAAEGRRQGRQGDQAPRSECRHQVAVGEHAREAGYVPRFKKRYNEVIKAELMKKFGYTNVMQVPKLNKVVLNIGAGEAASDGKKITQAVNDLTAIAGQKADRRPAPRRRSRPSRSVKAWPSAPRSRCAAT